MNFARWILKKISLHFCLYHLEILLLFAALNVTFHLSKIHLSNYRRYRYLSVVGPVKYFLVDMLCNKLKNRIDDTQFKAKLVQNQTQPVQFSFEFGRNKFFHLSIEQLAVPTLGMEFLPRRYLAQWSWLSFAANWKKQIFIVTSTLKISGSVFLLAYHSFACLVSRSWIL